MMETRNLGNIHIGFELPTITKTPTTRQLVQYAGASGDFYEIHYDKDFAVAQDLPGVILHGALKSAFLAQVVTDWIVGSSGRLAKFSVRYRDMDVPGDNLSCKGNVVSIDLGSGTVDCELWIENGAGGKTTTGAATIAFGD